MLSTISIYFSWSQEYGADREYGQRGLASGLELGPCLLYVSPCSFWTSSSLRRTCLMANCGEIVVQFKWCKHDLNFSFYHICSWSIGQRRSQGQVQSQWGSVFYFHGSVFYFLRERIFLTLIQSITYCLCSVIGRMLLWWTLCMLHLCCEGVYILQSLHRIEIEAYHKWSSGVSDLMDKISMFILIL